MARNLYQMKFLENGQMILKNRWKQLPLRWKLLSGLLAIVFFAAISMIILNGQMLHVVRNHEQIVNNYVPKLSNQLAVKNKILEQMNEVLLFLTTGDEVYKRNFFQSIEEAKKLNQQMLNHGFSAEKPMIEQIIFHTKNWEYYLKDKVLPVYDYGNNQEAIALFKNEAVPIALELINEVDTLTEKGDSEITLINHRILDHAWSSVSVGFIIIGVTILFTILFSFYVSRNMSNPIVEQLKTANRKLKEETERAKESTQLKSQFLANISHELRTPLTAIIGYAELMQTVRKDYTRQIVISAEHLLSMINDILDLSKIEAGKYELEVEVFDLRDAVFSSVQLLRKRAEQRGIQIKYQLMEKPFLMEGDEKRIRQVIINLLNNAIKFSHAGGTVTISLWDVYHYLFFSIKDEGIGIEEVKLDKIFEPFYQNDGGLGRKYDGTGLGLPLSKQFVELHHGTVCVKSESGKGSTFTVKLPVKHCAKKSDATGETEQVILVYTDECKPILAEIVDRVHKKGLEIYKFISVKELEGIHGKNIVLLFAGETKNEQYLHLLKEMNNTWFHGKIIAYIHQPLNVMEKEELLGIVDEVITGKESI